MSLRDLIRQPLPVEVARAIPAIVAVGRGADPVPIAGIAPIALATPPKAQGGIPPHVATGLARLGAMPTPNLLNPDLWSPIVIDARRLASEGWAASALGLGWHSLDLWGCWTGTDHDPGDDRRDGLAVWLNGRRIIALDDCTAAVASEKGCAWYHRPRDYGERVYLWQVGERRE